MSAVMPYYWMPVGTELEDVGFAFNRGVITGLLRDALRVRRRRVHRLRRTQRYRAAACRIAGAVMGRRAPERAGTDAQGDQRGRDQFGGEACPDVAVGLVAPARVDEPRIDESGPAALRTSSASACSTIPTSTRCGARAQVGTTPSARSPRPAYAQTRSIVMLQQRPRPCSPGRQLGASISRRSIPSEPAEEGDRGRPPGGRRRRHRPAFVLPYEPRDGNFVEVLFHAGALDFGEEEIARLVALMQRVPTVVDVYLDRSGSHSGARRRQLLRSSPTSARATPPCSGSCSAGRRRPGCCRSSSRRPWTPSGGSFPTFPTTPRIRSFRSVMGSDTRAGERPLRAGSSSASTPPNRSKTSPS